MREKGLTCAESHLALLRSPPYREPGGAGRRHPSRGILPANTRAPGLRAPDGIEMNNKASISVAPLLPAG